jgi:hypothetical protein
LLSRPFCGHFTRNKSAPAQVGCRTGSVFLEFTQSFKEERSKIATAINTPAGRGVSMANIPEERGLQATGSGFAAGGREFTGQ